MEVEVAHEKDDQEMMDIDFLNDQEMMDIDEFSNDSSNDSGTDNKAIEVIIHKILKYNILDPNEIDNLHNDVMYNLEFYYINKEDESPKRWLHSSCTIRGEDIVSYLRFYPHLRRLRITFIFYGVIYYWESNCPLHQITT